MEGAPVTEPARRAVFLDRDGTIIRDADYLTEIGQLEILPRVPEALRLLRKAGFLLLVVTNQSAIARGWLTEEGLAAIHAELNRRLQARGASVDAFYYCPHLPEGTVPAYARTCDCRKPAPGLIERAAREWHVDPARSYAIGDSERDAEAGRRAGCVVLLIGMGKGAARDLYEAARRVVAESAEEGQQAEPGH
jgi:D-glycero-D-manno-heptose 1,7-bisphosphate phosphatase